MKIVFFIGSCGSLIYIVLLILGRLSHSDLSTQIKDISGLLMNMAMMLAAIGGKYFDSK